MPWILTEPERWRGKFVHAARQREATLAAICKRFGVRRKNGYKMMKRHAELGLPGLREAARATTGWCALA